MMSLPTGGGFLLTSNLLLPSQANPAPVVVNTDTLDTPPYVSFLLVFFPHASDCIVNLTVAPPCVACGFQSL